MIINALKLMTWKIFITILKSWNPSWPSVFYGFANRAVQAALPKGKLTEVSFKWLNSKKCFYLCKVVSFEILYGTVCKTAPAGGYRFYCYYILWKGENQFKISRRLTCFCKPWPYFSKPYKMVINKSIWDCANRNKYGYLNTVS